MDIFARKPAVSPAQSQTIKQQVVDALSLDDDALVTVMELACRDDDCPDVEVVIAVLRQGQSKLQIKMDSSLAGMGEAQVAEACRLPEAAEAASLIRAEVVA